MRRLAWRDMRWCWQLASDVTVRQQSVDHRAPTLWGHLRWMARHIHGPARAYVFFLDGEQAGLVTLTPEGEAWRMGASVAPAYRGRGLARWAIAFTCLRLREPVRAQIRVGNIASQRAFLAAGFREVGRDTEWVDYRWGAPV